MNLKRLWRGFVWYVRSRFNRLEWQHTLAFGLLAFWALAIVVVDYPLYIETRELASQLASPSYPEASGATSISPKEAPRDLAKDFMASLPAYADYLEQLRALTTLADKRGISVKRIDYGYERISSLPLLKLTLRMDLSGYEIQQRRFMQTALNTFANMAITRIAYSRNVDTGADANLKLEISLYYRLDKVPT